VTTTTPSTDVAVVDPAFSDAERYALAGFLAGYRGGLPARRVITATDTPQHIEARCSGASDDRVAVDLSRSWQAAETARVVLRCAAQAAFDDLPAWSAAASTMFR
jgi:hypothetical protein